MAARSETLKLIISGDGRLLGTELGKTEEQVKKFEKNTGSIFTRLGSHITHKLKDIITSPLAMIGEGAGIFEVGKELIDFDDKLLSVGLRASLTSKDMAVLRKEIMDTALATGQSRDSIVEALNNSDLQFSRAVLKDMAIASTATGATMSQMGEFVNSLHEKFELSSDDISKALNILTIQGKTGKFTLGDMANNAERLFTVLSSFNSKGLHDVSGFGALLQMAVKGTGSPERGLRSIESMAQNILDKQRVINFRYGSVYSNPATRELKSMDQIVKQVIAGSHGNIREIQRIFGPSSYKGLRDMVFLYKETHGFNFFDNMANADLNQKNVLMNDFNEKIHDTKYQFGQLVELSKTFSDSAFAPIIAEISSKLKELTSDPAKMADFSNKLENIANALGNIGKAAIAVSPGLELLGGLAEMFVGSDRMDKTNFAAQAFKQLSKEEQKKLRPLIRGDKWDSGIYSIMMKYHPEKMKNVDNDYSNIVSNFNSLPKQNRQELAGKDKIDLKNLINIQVTVSDSGKIVASTDSSNTKIKVNRGAF